LKILLKFLVLGLLSALLFPPFFILPIGFIIFPTIFFLISKQEYIKKSKSFHFLTGFFYGLGLNLLVLNWIKEPFLLDSNSKNIFILSYLLIIYCSIFYGISFYFLSFFKNKILKLLLIPVFFVASEILREIIGFGFPWVTFALVNSSQSTLLSLSYYFGTYGMSYITILLFLFPASIFLFLNNNNNFILKIYIYFSLMIIFICLVLIFVRYNFIEYSNKKNITVSIAQMNFKQTEIINNNIANKRVREIQEVINQNDSELIIFAENNYPYMIENFQELNEKFINLQDNQSIIIGATNKLKSKFFNSLILFEKNKIQNFDKIILVPFGEFLPFRKFLNFIDKIVGKNDYSPGIKERFIKTVQDIKILPVICYEIIFFNNLLDTSNIDSNLLVNITNDSWFGDLSGPYQHFYLSRIRASEFNMSLIRVSNNGISGVIDNYGKIIDFIPLNEKLIKKIKFSFIQKPSNLTDYHFLLYPFLIILLLFALLLNKKQNE